MKFLYVIQLIKFYILSKFHQISFRRLIIIMLKKKPCYGAWGMILYSTLPWWTPTNPVGSVLGLQVEGGIPVGIKDDHIGGAGDVEAHAARLRRHQEYEDPLVLVKLLD